MSLISTATPADLPELTPLFDRYRQFYGQASNMEKAMDFLRERMEQEESVIFLYRDSHGALLGFTQLYPIFSSVSLRRAWLLNDLFVEAHGRRQGVAAALLHRAEQHGRESGAAWLLLSTGADNFTAQSVYEKNGWIQVIGWIMR